MSVCASLLAFYMDVCYLGVLFILVRLADAKARRPYALDGSVCYLKFVIRGSAACNL